MIEMKKIFLLIILASLFIGSVPNKAYACSCLSANSPLHSLEGSDAVFLGKVTNTEGIPRGDEEFVGADDVMITFEVSKVWKGPPSKTLVVVTALEGATCGLGRSFMIGEEYIVYASSEGGELRTHLCTRTAHITTAQEDLAELNTLVGGSSDDPELLSQSIIYYLILGTVGLVITAILVTKKWSSR